MQNNHPAQAIHYRIASLWSHHETSLFMWLVILNATTYILRLPPAAAHVRGRILGLLNCLLGFYMLVEANPFTTTPIAQLFEESHGLNPLLYDINMVWHPPLLYLRHMC
jgi:cytochrome c biogenesis factor